MRVILVEDHDDTRRGLAALLRVTGHFVTDVAGIDDVLAVLDGSRGRYDCAIIDLSLPPGDSDRIAVAALRAGVHHCVALGSPHANDGQPRQDGVQQDGQPAAGDRSSHDGIDGSARFSYAARLGKPVVVEDLNRVLRHLASSTAHAAKSNPAP